MSAAGTGSCGPRPARSSLSSKPRPVREGDGSAARRRDPGHRLGLRSGGLRRQDRVQRLRRHRRRGALLDRHLEPGCGHLRPGRRQGSLPAHHGIARRPDRGVRSGGGGIGGRQPCVLTCGALRLLKRGFFLIEAMVAILIFALGILGLVAMGGTAVSSQSDAQYRTEASSLADAIAGEVALGSTARARPTRRRRLLNFAHQANPAPSDVPPPCSFSGTPINAGTAPGVATLLQPRRQPGPGAGSARARRRPISRSSSTPPATSTAS